MHARRRSWRIKWWVWVAMLTAGLVAVALGLGWFLVVAVSMAWVAAAMFTRAAPTTPAVLDVRTLVSEPHTAARAQIRSASSEELCTLWEQTGQEMKRTYLPSSLCSYADLRHAILDELTARDPDGVRRWLGDRPDRRDPRSYLHDRQI